MSKWRSRFEFSGGNLSSDKDMLLDDILEEMSYEIYGKPYGNLNKKQQMNNWMKIMINIKWTNKWLNT